MSKVWNPQGLEQLDEKLAKLDTVACHNLMFNAIKVGAGVLKRNTQLSLTTKMGFKANKKLRGRNVSLVDGVKMKHDNTLCEIYRLSITKEQYEILERSIQKFKENEGKYRYNFAGLVAMLFNIPFERQYHYVCSQFVAYVLHEAKAGELEKHFTLMRPYDFKSLSNLDLVYSGKLSEYSV